MSNSVIIIIINEHNVSRELTRQPRSFRLRQSQTGQAQLVPLGRVDFEAEAGEEHPGEDIKNSGESSAHS